MMHILRVIFLTFFAAALLSAATPSVDVWNAQSGLSFEPNQGQLDREVRYFARTQGGVVFFTNREVVLRGASGALRFELLGADAGAAWHASDPTSATTSYYVRRDARTWARDVPHYRRLIRNRTYPDIDVVYYGNANRLEYDFLLAPHADPSRIRIRTKARVRSRSPKM